MAKIFTKGLDNLEFNTGEDFAALFEEVYSDTKKEGSIVKAKITNIDDDAVTVDVGLKTEGRISLKEFVRNGQLPELNIGDEIDVYLQSYENRYGKPSLSYERAVRESSWERLERAMQEKTPVDGIVFGRVKGGLTVDLNGVIAFLPGSQVDIKPIKDINPMIGLVQPFMVLKIDRDQGNIVVSRRAIIEESRKEARDEMFSKIKVGDVLEGVVKNITDYGAFLDLGNLDGLLHVTDVSWTKINHPSELLSLGQKVKVQVIKYDEVTKRVSLGMKQLEQNPWEGLDSKYPVGKRMKGKVGTITDYGVFVELEPGIEGLVHVSEMTWFKNNQHPRKLVQEGQEVEFVILDVDIEKHRISLGMKQCMEDPWKNFADKYPIGAEIQGTISRIVDFGLFISFGEEIDGLVHVNDLSWGDDNEKLLKSYKAGEPIKVVVLSVDSEKERISLGVKQLLDDPFEKVTANMKKGSVITCVVTAVEKEGITVEISNGISSFIKRQDLSSDKIDQRTERFNEGDRLDAKVTMLDKTNRKISLSIRELEQDEQKRKIAAYGSASSGASLGDILGAAISAAEEEKSKK